MNAFDALLEAAGRGHELMGSNVLYEPPTGEPAASPAYGRLHKFVGRKMLRFDYRWSLRSEAHEGTLLIACDPDVPSGTLAIAANGLNTVSAIGGVGFIGLSAGYIRFIRAGTINNSATVR